MLDFEALLKHPDDPSVSCQNFVHTLFVCLLIRHAGCGFILKWFCMTWITIIWVYQWCMAWLYTQLEARGTTGQKARLASAGIVVSWLLNLYKNRLLLFRLFILICAPICMALSRRLTTYSIVHSVRMKTGSCHSEYHAHVLYTLTCRQSWYAGRSNNSSPPGLHWRVSCGVMHGNYMAQYAPSNIALYLLSNSGCLRCRAADMDTCVHVCACVCVCVTKEKALKEPSPPVSIFYHRQ